MKILWIEIRNFRSIEYIKIIFDSKLKILVGKNEAGKSNILKALSLFKYNPNTNKNDIRIPLQNEPLPTESYVQFRLLLENNDIFDAESSINGQIAFTENLWLLEKEGLRISNKNILKEAIEFTYRVDIMNQKNYLLNNFVKGCSINPNLMKLKEKISFTDNDLNEWGINPNDYVIINIEDYPNIPPEILEECTLIDIQDFYESIYYSLLDNKASLIFWSYDEANILPAKVNRTQFITKPDSCLPLQYMFELAGIQRIKDTVEEEIKRGTHGLRNLLARVSENTTTHFHSIWKEYNSIEFELLPDGENINIGIKDSFNCFEFEQRSDGFKRFVTFLLLISTRVRNNELSNCLLLIDEPGLGLHPSGERYLRDELFKISENNYVVYSTHSIFMIDKEHAEKHFIVKKNNELSFIETVNESNIFDEEVICNALGYSVFENLRKMNIIFEGWKDKKLFIEALKRIPRDSHEIRNFFENFGICHAKGVKHVKSIIPILDLANREYFILSDGDTPAKEKQKEYDQLRYSGPWFRYDQLVEQGEISNVTSEDFIKLKVFVNVLNELRKEYVDIPKLNENDLINPQGILAALDISLRNYDKEKRKELIRIIKDRVFDELKNSDIQPSYYKVLAHLKKSIENWQSSLDSLVHNLEENVG